MESMDRRGIPVALVPPSEICVAAAAERTQRGYCFATQAHTSGTAIHNKRILAEKRSVKKTSGHANARFSLLTGINLTTKSQ
jgi:hypothetical protein